MRPVLRGPCAHGNECPALVAGLCPASLRLALVCTINKPQTISSDVTFLSTCQPPGRFGMTDVAMYGVTWISDDLRGHSAHDDGDEVRRAGGLRGHLGLGAFTWLSRCCDNLQVGACRPAAASSNFRVANESHHLPCCAPQDIKELANKHLGPLVKNLLPAGKKLPIKRAVK